MGHIATSRPRTPPARIAALLAALALPAMAWAQSTNHPQTKPAPGRVQPTTKPAPAPSEAPAAAPSQAVDPASVVEFGEAPFRIDSAGLSMLLPLDATAQTSAGSKTAAQIVGKDRTWLINVQIPHSDDPDTTTAQLCDQIVTDYFKKAGEVYDSTGPDPSKKKLTGVKGHLLEARKEVTIDKQLADRVYFSTPGARPKDAPVVRGLTVIKNAAKQFLIFELVTTEPAFAKAKGIYETTVQTATLEDPSKLNAERAAALAAGQKVLQDLGPNALQNIVSAGGERWERRYKPVAGNAAKDATELGYRRIRTMVGSRAMLDPKEKNPAGAANHQQGLIWQMDARILDSGFVIDSQAAYFLSPDPNPDLSEEAWTVKNAFRKDGKTDVLSEIGARTGKSMVVNIEGTGRPQRTITPVFQGDGYISAVEAYMLPQLLLKAGVTTDFAFYTYRPEVGGITMRRDTLSQPADKPGLWVVTTRLTNEKSPMVSYFNSKGELIRTEMTDGSIWEPITKEKLVQLWTSKNLPMK